MDDHEVERVILESDLLTDGEKEVLRMLALAGEPKALEVVREFVEGKGDGMRNTTPGPWTLTGWNIEQDDASPTGQRKVITSAYPGADGFLISGRCAVAEVRRRGIVAFADARLIAAAPEMLATLTAIVHQLSSGEASEGDARDIAWCAAQARAVIRKAEGFDV